MDWPGLIPLLFLVWVFAAMIAIGELAYSERRGRLPARPILTALQRWLVLGGLFTLGTLLNVAHGQELMATWQLVAIVILMMGAGYALSLRKA